MRCISARCEIGAVPVGARGSFGGLIEGGTYQLDVGLGGVWMLIAPLPKLQL